MNITNPLKVSDLDGMFDLVGLEKELLHNALKEMGSKYLVVDKDKWSSEKPTTGYCYVVSEVVYHYYAPRGTRPARLENSERSSHWFLVYPGNVVIDLTLDQNPEPFDYHKAEFRNFYTEALSNRAKVLANILNLL